MSIARLCLAILLACLTHLNADDQLWFGTIAEQGTLRQARFEVKMEGTRFRNIVLVPYGLSPTILTALRHDGNLLAFSLVRGSDTFRCSLKEARPRSFEGACVDAEGRMLQMVLREFAPADAILQGNARVAENHDLEIIVRVRELLGNGKSWNRSDNRVCDTSAYPYKWSLFCALHQASMEIVSQYEHLRPVMKAVRQAITNRHPNRNFAHTLRDFNNEAADFQVILSILDDAMVLLKKQMPQ